MPGGVHYLGKNGLACLLSVLATIPLHPTLSKMLLLAALFGVLEPMATIVAALPGEFIGGTTVNRYFIMTAATGSGSIARDDDETASVKWMTIHEARQHIGQTTNSTGRKRDLAVLEAAAQFWNRS